jgi:hypothetical protein
VRCRLHVVRDQQLTWQSRAVYVADISENTEHHAVNQSAFLRGRRASESTKEATAPGRGLVPQQCAARPAPCCCWLPRASPAPPRPQTAAAPAGSPAGRRRAGTPGSAAPGSPSCAHSHPAWFSLSLLPACVPLTVSRGMQQGHGGALAAVQHCMMSDAPVRLGPICA